MNMLVSPVDALVFDYVSFGIFAAVNNLWTWVAIVTAAFSFWRIRAAAGVGAHVKLQPPTPATSACIDRNVNGSPPFSETSPADTPASVPPKLSEAPTPSSVPSVLEVDGVTKRKFVAYYENNDGGDDGENGELTAEVDDGGYDGGEWWERWERLLRMRKGEMGWYSYQDLTAINGNVIRLWDEVELLEKKNIENYSSGCVVVW